MSNIPKAREIIEGELHEIDNQLIEAKAQWDRLKSTKRQLMTALSMMTRRPLSRPRAPVKHKPVSLRVKREIKRFARENPDIHLDEIATRFDTNHGRVSEILQG